MKSLLKMTLLGSAIVLALAGCDDKKDNTAATQQSTNQNVENVEINEDSEAYAVGASFANYLKDNLARGQISLKSDQVVKGFSDALNDKAKYSKEEIQTILTAFDTRIQTEAKAKLEAEKEASIKAGDEFRKEFATKEGVKSTESGILYEIIEQGTGKHPTANDTVIVHYKGTLVDGKQFDSSYDRGEPTKFPLNAVIKGWIEGIQLIDVGGKIKLVIPPELAYGDQSIPGSGDNAAISPDSTLVFDVELLGIDGDTNANTAQ